MDHRSGLGVIFPELTDDGHVSCVPEGSNFHVGGNESEGNEPYSQ